MNNVNNDLISRHQAIDAVKKNTFRLKFVEEQNYESGVAWSTKAVYSDLMEEALLDLPSVQPDTTIHGHIPVDCISRQAALNLFPDDNLYWDTNEGYFAPHYARTKLMTLPLVQSDIIHCKDCAYCDCDVINVPYGITEKIWWCNKLCAGANENLIVEPDDFCSFAERREDDRLD